ncbi:MAG: quinone-dependent dihydroorotate dehydrogenase [Alicyclobacillaceae bacterium]|nr:quinone-dependent dihydroorotate dehydrogenase [Alicyclobacillaceae bacterium]
MYRLVRPFLFQFSPETAHRIVIRTLSMLPGCARLACPAFTPPPELEQTLWGVRFPHPIGLAAGLDKNGEAVDGMLACGFAFVEIGTVTPRPQPGNPQPRLFRLPEDGALINRMGFNNQGAEAVLRHLLRRRRRGIVGVNIGKNKSTPNESAADDYESALSVLFRVADYFVINVSSPNTPGLRDLQAADSLRPLVRQVLARRQALFEASLDRIRPHRPPVLVKLAPDLPDEQIQSLVEALLDEGIDGFIATNTTVARPALSSPHAAEPGGLSGRPLRARATEVVRLVRRTAKGKVPIIASGGVFTAADAYEKIRAGANLVQVYTAMIYEGPAIVGRLVRGLAEQMRKDGFASVADAVGTDAGP